MAFHLLKYLRAFTDLELTVILLNEGRLARELRAAGLTVQMVDERRHSFPHIANAIRKILAPHPPAILHSHRYKENLLAFLVSSLYPDIYLMTTQHGLPEFPDQSASWRQNITSKSNFFALSRFFKRVVAVSGDIREIFVNDLGFREERVVAIHNGINIPPTVCSKAVGGPFVIGSSGRLFPVKDYPLMVRVAREMTPESEIFFALAGDGPERGVIEKAVDEFGLAEKFSLKGHLEEMDSFYRGLDLYLNTSIHEGIPMTILEAMAHGLPVIAPKVGGIGEIIQDGVEGFLIPSRNPKAFAEKCLLLQDPELRHRMGQAARAKVEKKFSVEQMARQYYQLYRELGRII